MANQDIDFKPKTLICKECGYRKIEKHYGLQKAGLIELAMLRDIHVNTFRHAMEII